ncbi:RAB15 protein, partial [Penelope pileata]|nr:RAB15 protein [Penelope pileata]
RLLLLGDSGVGKTCLLCRFTDNEFHPAHISTIGTGDAGDSGRRGPGASRHREMGNGEMGAGIFLVYDIGSERSYQHIVKWASDVDELAREYGMDFYETSACSNLNIKESFTRLTELVLQAHRKELAGLRAAPPELAQLEEDEQQPPGGQENPKNCWC